MLLPTDEMTIAIDCNGYAWQIVDRHWRSTRKYTNMTFYVVEAPHVNGPAEFERQFGPLTIIERMIG